MHDTLDIYLPESVRDWLEQHYYARVNAQARFEELIDDPDFWVALDNHVGLFCDHGVVHVRDVSRQILQVLNAIHGLLIPARPSERFEGFMKGYGVTLAYLHDIGMADFSAFGRAMHPEFAAQAVLSPEFDSLVGALWEHDGGGVASRLRALAAAGALPQPAELVFREMLTLSMAHSKSKVPVAILNDRAALRRLAQECARTDLRTLYILQRRAKGKAVPADAPASADDPVDLLSRYYGDPERDSFAWLLAAEGEGRALVDDIVDTLRALRVADALRQRGTVQKTSGGYEMFISQQTGYAIYALRLGNDQLYLLETPGHHCVGEANIASTDLDHAGNLRISFYRGAYASQDAIDHAVKCTAMIVQDIRADVIESFHRPAEQGPPELRPAEAIETWLESTDDNPSFVDLIRTELRRISPATTANVDIVPSLRQVPDLERSRYLAASPVAWDLDQRRELLRQMDKSGCKIEGIDPLEAFRHVRLARLDAGETLIEAGAPATMAYVPLGDGLRIIPLGGYASFSIRAWMPLGNTGIIRGGIRNGTVVASQPVGVLIIPKDVYLRHWHHTYTAEELQQRLVRAPAR